ncbi:unnamed protein product [Owenia fusiformis]|uniref:Carbohydrate sulfotransferase n=1 Tax=Owenia fusiformis TaxID=6347 RepID=A0A8S4PHJ8_OWEFU|nr:unnamed protein product [Owenia fusiformis]
MPWNKIRKLYWFSLVFSVMTIIATLLIYKDQLLHTTEKELGCRLGSDCSRYDYKNSEKIDSLSKPVRKEDKLNHFYTYDKYQSQQTQQDRTEHLKRKCKEFGLNKSLNISKLWKSFFFVNHKYKFVYCAMPKVGCTFMKRLLFVLDGKTQSKNPYSIPAKWAHSLPLNTLQHKTKEDIEYYLKYYKKIVFVRDPIKRLLSAHTDKLASVTVGAWKHQGRPIMKKIRKNPTETDLKCGHNTSFQEFLDYRIKQEESNKKPDMHFDMMYRTCHPCMIDYDFIGKMESFNNDVKYLLDSVNIAENITFTEKFDVKMDYLKDMVHIFLTNINGAKNCGLDFKDCLKIFWKNLVQRNVIPPRKIFPTLHENVARRELIDIVVGLKENIHDGSEKVNPIETISKETMLRIQELYKNDFELMGYEKYV